MSLQEQDYARFEIDRELERAKQTLTEKYIANAKIAAARQFEHHRPMLTDLLQGYMPVEVAHRHGVNRIHAYSILRTYGITRPSKLMQRAARRLGQCGGYSAKMTAKLESCACFSCQWIIRRQRLSQANEIDDSLNR